MPLPRLVVLTDRHRSEAASRPLVVTVERAVAAGAKAVLLREKDLATSERRALARDVAAVVHAAAAMLLVASDIDLAHEVGADAVHLAASDRWPARGELGGLLAGRSCHTVSDVATAGLCAAAYVTLSPVHRTASKPGYGPPLSLEELAEGCRAPGAPPVFALGGIEPGRAAPCIEAGAAGVAVMGAVMAAPEPGTVIAALLEEVGP